MVTGDGNEKQKHQVRNESWSDHYARCYTEFQASVPSIHDSDSWRDLIICIILGERKWTLILHKNAALQEQCLKTKLIHYPYRWSEHIATILNPEPSHMEVGIVARDALSLINWVTQSDSNLNSISKCPMKSNKSTCQYVVRVTQCFSSKCETWLFSESK